MCRKGCNKMDTEFNFDYWMKLAQSDSEAFENKRRETIEELIHSMPEQYHRKLRQLQWKIDTIREVSPNPLASCIRISNMLMDHTYGEGGLLESLNALVQGRPSAKNNAAQKSIGKVLEFAPRQERKVN